MTSAIRATSTSFLTGRRDRFNTIRQYQGLNGFLLRTESDHDCYGAGHAGTSLSAALGMAVARDRRGGRENVVVVAGDAAFTCGTSYEALNNVADSTKRFIVVLNDNEWSIAKNVGAIANYLNKLVTNDAYSHLHEKAAKFVEMIGGRFAQKLVHKVEEGVKHLVLPSVIFEDLGLRYYGPIDGHDIPLLIQTFEFLKRQNEPVLLHIITQKGKGYAPALAKPDKFHGLGKFKLETGETTAAPTPTYSELFGQTLAKFADQNNRIVAITAAMPSGTGLFHFAARHPQQYFDVGIAEEHAALFASGLATEGFKPFLAIYSTFMQRAYDMIIHDIALQNLNVALCMDRAGLAATTVRRIMDFLISGTCGTYRTSSTCNRRMRMNSSTCSGRCSKLQHGPIAMRYPRGAGIGAKLKETPPAPNRQGRSREARREVAIFGLGDMCAMAEEAAKILEEKGISTAVINPRWIKPLDRGPLNFLRVASTSSARWKITCCTTASAAQSSSTSLTPESRRRSSESAGQINSSSTARFRFCGKNTA